MSGMIAEGSWVKIRFHLLETAERAAGLPIETAEHPYEVYATGRLEAAAKLGEQVTIRTQIGRTVQGELCEDNPGHWHTYGAAPAAFHEVTNYIDELRRSLRHG